MADQPYTPTTQHVQNAYVDTRYNLASERGELPPPIMERYAEFERWQKKVITAAEQRGAIKALRGAAESVDLIDHMFANLRVNQPRAVRETSKYLHNRADQMEGDDD